MGILFFLAVFALLFLLARPGGKRRSSRRSKWRWFKRSRPKKRSESFYEQPAWKKIRDRRRAENNKRHNLGKTDKGVLLLRCMRCGIVGTGHQIDHVKPRSTHPRHALRYSNTQVLCSTRSKPKAPGCNQKKSNKEGPNWRRVRALPAGDIIAWYLRNKQVKDGKR